MQNVQIQSKPATLRPIPEYSSYAFMDALPAYNLNPGVDELLDLARQIAIAGNYYNLTVPFPNLPTVAGSAPINANPGQTISGTINVPPYAYLVSIACFSLNAGGFKVRIMDKGSKTDIFDTLYGLDQILASNNTPAEPNVEVDTNSSLPIGQYYLTSPVIVLPPGVLQIDMSNMDVAANCIQISLQFAVPSNKTSQQIPIVSMD